MGTIHDIKTTTHKPSSVDQMHWFQLATYRRLAPNASGLVQLETLVKTKKPQRVYQAFEITEADIRATEKLYPLAQAAMRSGYFVPNRNSRLCSRRNCPYWRRCELEYGGVVEES